MLSYGHRSFCTIGVCHGQMIPPPIPFVKRNCQLSKKLSTTSPSKSYYINRNSGAERNFYDNSTQTKPHSGSTGLSGSACQQQNLGPDGAAHSAAQGAAQPRSVPGPGATQGPHPPAGPGGHCRGKGNPGAVWQPGGLPLQHHRLQLPRLLPPLPPAGPISGGLGGLLPASGRTGPGRGGLGHCQYL